MSKPIGHRTLAAAFLLYGLIYNPWVMRNAPQSGWLEILASPQIYFLVATVIIARLRNLTLKDFGLEPSKLLKRALIGLGIGLIPGVFTICMAGLLTWINHFHPFLKRPFFGGPPIELGFPPERIVILLVLAPITEELFFRGILLRGLLEDFSKRTAVILSAVIFMAGHGGWFLPGPLSLGLITAPMMLITGSVVPGIAFHSMSNLYGPIMVWFFPNLYRYLSFMFQ